MITFRENRSQIFTRPQRDEKIKLNFTRWRAQNFL